MPALLPRMLLAASVFFGFGCDPTEGVVVDIKLHTPVTPDCVAGAAKSLDGYRQVASPEPDKIALESSTESSRYIGADIVQVKPGGTEVDIREIVIGRAWGKPDDADRSRLDRLNEIWAGIKERCVQSPNRIINQSCKMWIGLSHPACESTPRMTEH